MSAEVETDFGQPPIIYPEGFIKSVAEEENGVHQQSSSGGSGSSSSNTSQTLLTSVVSSPAKNVELQDPVGLGKERHLSSSSTGSRRKGSEQPVEYYCGVGRCRPSWMQRLRDARFFTFLLCLNTFIEGALVSGFTSVVLSTIERRYQFSSTAAGLIASTFDMAVLVSVVFISYFGGKGHKPRILGISLIVQGTGAFVFSLPQFVFGSYQVGSNAKAQLESCDAGVDFSSECNETNSFALAFFFIGNILIGVGAAPLFTVGTSYLDDIVKPKHVSIHVGLVYFMTVVGPALGYGLGGAFLSIYVDPWLETNLEPSDPGWVGAWWLCFIFSGVVSWILAIPFLLFPRLLPDSHLVKKERELEMAQKYESKYGANEDTNLLTKLKSFPYHLKQVVTTVSWIFITGAICSSIIVISGMVSFAPKYLESQFTLTASNASLIAGGVAIPAGGAGVITGAFIIYLSKSKGRRVALINWIVSAMIILPIFVFLVHCPTVNLAGVTQPYADGSQVSSNTSPLNSSCSASCMCNSTVFEPVCGADGLTYFSPCQAGCQKYYIDGDLLAPSFENCSCISDSLASQLLTRQSGPGDVSGINDTDTLSSFLLANGTVTDGRCDQGCNKLGLFLALMAIALFLIFILQVPYVIITVRCVADEQRSLALGVQSLMFRAFGSIPGPIVFGVIFDSACLFWQFECGRRGNCWVYDNVDLSNRALGLAVSGVVLNFIFSFLSWLVYPKNKANEENSESKKSDQDEENVKDNASVASSDSYTIGGPAVRPIQRTSLVGRMESHCSEDLLLDSTDTGHIDDNIPMTDLSGGRGREIHDAAMRSNAIVETETALHENYIMHNMRARSFGSTSPVQVVASPPQ